MSNVQRKSPPATRADMESRIYEAEPPPTRDEIRRELGWTLVEAERKTRPAERDE